MTTDSERLARMERRQEAIIQAINLQTEAVTAVGAMVQRIDDFLRQPPSSDLADTLRAILAAVTEINAMVTELHEAAFERRE